MEDEKIIELFWKRNQRAIEETDAKYGHYCHTVAFNILNDPLDTEECVNDTWMGAWNAMPDAWPNCLGAFLTRICRNIALNLLSSKKRLKRGKGEMTLALEELAECTPSNLDVAQIAEARELSEGLDRFLATLPNVERNVFMSRYWAMASVKEISEVLHWSESRTKSTLFRIREKLRKFLQEEGLY